MNLFRLAGDLTHLASFVVLLLKILATRSCRGKKRACVAEGGSSSRSFYEGTGSQKKTSFFQSRRSMARTDSGACSPIPLSFSLSLSLSLPPLTPETGISLRTQELYTLVFVCRYLDLFTR
jgi:hypothetical protein